MKFGFRHIRYFIAVAEELHFRRAAERLGIAQPALSRAIRALEQDLGVTLFERSNKRVEITRAGQAFLTGCRGVVNAIGQAAETARQVHQGRQGLLRIGYTDMAIAGPLPTLLKEFQDVEPGIVLQPHHDVTVTQLQKLDEGELDVGFVTGPINRSGYAQLPVQSERFIAVVYRHHRLAGRRAIRLEELAQEDFVHGSSKDWQQFHSYLIPLCRRAGFVPRIRQEAFNTAGILGLVACGMGVTVLSDSARNSMQAGLVAIPIEDVAEQLETVAVWRPGRPDRSRDLFIEHLRRTRPRAS